jgi:hypothetical protein
MTWRRSFFVVMTALLSLAVLVGFARTLYLRPLFGLPDMPGYLYVHGAVLTSWFALLAVQVSLVRRGSTATHRRVGPYGAVLAVAVIGTGCFTLALGDAPFVDESLSRSFGNLLSLVGFAFCVSVGVVLRNRPEAHKRLMLLGSILITAPALDRAGQLPVLQRVIDPLLPNGLGSTGPVFAGIVTVALMLAVVGYDLVTRRRPHMATLVGLVGIWGLGSAISAALIRSGVWRAFVRFVS